MEDERPENMPEGLWNAMQKLAEATTGKAYDSLGFTNAQLAFLNELHDDLSVTADMYED